MLAGLQRLDLGQREIVHPPVFLLPHRRHALHLAIGKLRVIGHIRRVRKVRVVAGDQHAVLGHHQVRLDEVRPLINGRLIGEDRVFRKKPARAAMGDDDRLFPGQGGIGGRLLRRRHRGLSRARHLRRGAGGKHQGGNGYSVFHERYLLAGPDQNLM